MKMERQWHVFNYLPSREVWLCSVPRSQLKTVLSESVLKKRDEPKRGGGKVIKQKCRLWWDAAWSSSDWLCAKSTRTTCLLCTTCGPQRTLTHKANHHGTKLLNNQNPLRTSNKTPVESSDTGCSPAPCFQRLSQNRFPWAAEFSVPRNKL